MRYWRKATWGLIVWSGVMWALILQAPIRADCSAERKFAALNDLYDTMEAGCYTGVAIFVVGAFILWAVGFGVLAFIWSATRPRDRRADPRE